MDIMKYLIDNGIGYDDFAYCVGCSTGYLIDIVHGKPCSKKLKERISEAMKG
jgi:hypothetical protein